MARARVLAVLAIGLLVVYHLFRLLATRCAGASCDWFIPLSLLLPLLVLGLAGFSGVAAIPYTRDRPSQRTVLIIATLASVIGPVVSLLLLRDNPDTLVPAATVQLLLAPIAALALTRPR